MNNVGFHDIAYHSGEPISHDPWTVAIVDDSITWSTTTYDVEPNANALRYDTIYNFYFDANVGPAANTCTIGLFKPGTPSTVAAATIGPSLAMIDCNHNGVPDACDLDCDAADCQPPCGQSVDCNGNSIPDECEPDCNHNGIADGCDIANCPPGALWCADCDHNGVPNGCEADCDHNGVPDACDQMPDSDGDGIPDCFDLCPLTTPPGACASPPIAGCRFSTPSICIPNFPRGSCIEQGGMPLCSATEPGSCEAAPCAEAICRFGCLLGDFNGDGIIDLRDYGACQSCFSGRPTSPGFRAPSGSCLIHLDFDEDGDIDTADYAAFEAVFRGP